MSIEHVDIESIKPDERPYTSLAPAEGLMADIQQHGIHRPLMVDGSTIVDGVRRWNIARELGLETVPVLVDPEFMEALENLQPTHSADEFRVPYDTRWFDLLPLWNYVFELGRKYTRSVRARGFKNGRPQHFAWGQAITSQLEIQPDIIRKLRAAAILAKEHEHEPVVQHGLEQMRRGDLGPVGFGRRVKVYLGDGNMRTAEEHAQTYRAIITNLQANARLMRSLGPMKDEMDPEIRRGLLQELDALVGDHRRLVNRLQGVVRARYLMKEEPTA